MNRPYLSLVLAGGFVVLSMIAIGIDTHAWFEIRDSIEHGEAEAASFDPQAPRHPAEEHPEARLRRLRDRKAKIEESFLAPIAVGACFGILLVLLWRKIRRGAAPMLPAQGRSAQPRSRKPAGG